MITPYNTYIIESKLRFGLPYNRQVLLYLHIMHNWNQNNTTFHLEEAIDLPQYILLLVRNTIYYLRITTHSQLYNRLL